jgi:beta-galactosidase
MPSIYTNDGDGYITVSGNGFEVKINKDSGEISLKHGDAVARGLNTPVFYRALTDNDKRKLMYDKNDKGVSATWESAGLNRTVTVCKSISIIKACENFTRIAIKYISSGSESAEFETKTLLTVFGDGRLLFDNTVTPSGDLPSLLRIGSSTTLSPEYSNCSWYGFGPYETYPDRCSSGRLGLYTEKVGDPYENYVMPQECGAKMECTYMMLANASGSGFCFYGVKPYTMSSLSHTPEELDRMTHYPDTLGRDKVVFTVDYAMSGLGNRSCGPDVLPKYRITPEKARYAYTLCYLTGNGDLKLNSYPTDILPAIEEKNSTSLPYSEEEYRDPSDEDIRKKSGFTVG